MIRSFAKKYIESSISVFCGKAKIRLLSNGRKTIVIGLSGGVDSSAAGILLKQNYGSNVSIEGVHIRSWIDNYDDNAACPAASTDEDYQDALLVAEKLKINVTKIDLVREYWLRVFEPMLEDYSNGLTPNPDIVCNQAIKFSALFDKIDKLFGRDCILATGHYAQIELDDNYYSNRLLTSADSLHDQTFFLAQVPSLALSRTLFPVGHMSKDAARKLVLSSFGGSLERINKRPSSAGLCFVGRRRSFADFIDQFLPPKPGHFIDVDSKTVVGSHTGRHHYAIGQRVRIPGVERAYYVVDKQRQSNPDDILVASGAGHPALFTRTVITSCPFWIGPNPFDEAQSDVIRCHFRFQHQHPLVRCEVKLRPDNTLLVNLTERAMRAVSPGQYAVFYMPRHNSLSAAFCCLGSARIVDNRPSLLECGITEHQPMHQMLFA